MVVVVIGLAGSVSAQDARAVLQASLKAMGGENLKTIQYSGAGWSSAIGQTYGLDTDWPHFEVAGPVTYSISSSASSMYGSRSGPGFTYAPLSE